MADRPEKFCRKGRTARNNRSRNSNEKRKIGLIQGKLLLWSIQYGMSIKSLTPSNFSSTGRGLKTTRCVEIGDVIISVPICLLITFDVIWKKKIFKDLLKNNTVSKLSTKTAFSLFLIIEKKKGQNSFYYNYLRSVPETYTTPITIPEKFCNNIPQFLLAERESQFNITKRQLKEITECLSYRDCGSLNVSIDDVIWAWNVINTRSIYFSHNDLICREEINPIQIDFALAPVLDLLNHNDKANIKACFNSSKNVYEITTYDSYKSNEQIFINYGAHSNRKLLFEYGFVIPDNTHAYIPVPVEILEKRFRCCVPKRKQIEDQLGIKLANIGIGVQGPDWTFLVVAHILCSSTVSEQCIIAFPKQCTTPCIIVDGLKDIFNELIMDHEKYLQKLNGISTESVENVKSLLSSELCLLKKVLEKISSNCLL